MAINLLIPAGVAGLGGLGYWLWKRHQAAAYVPPDMVTPQPQAYGPPAAPPAQVDPGFVPGPDPLGPPGGYTPGGYNPYIPTMPDYQNPADDPPYTPPYAPPTDYFDPNAPSNQYPEAPEDPGTDWIGPDSPLTDLNPVNWFSGTRNPDSTFHLLRQRRMLRRRGL